MWKGERSFFGLNETKPELMLVLGDVVVISYRMCGSAIPPPSTTTFGCGLRAFDLDRQSVALQNMLVTCSVEEFIAEFQEVRRQKPNKKKIANRQLHPLLPLLEPTAILVWSSAPRRLPLDS